MSAKVFVASTCFDLIDVRAELENEIRELGLTPYLSDSKLSDFDYGDEAVGRNSIDLCRHNLKSCDYVIFVLSQRYGHELERYGYPGISATHLEYRTAIEHNKDDNEKKKLKILFFVRDRTIVDYDRWRKDKSIDKKFLMYTKDAKLFDFIEEHATIHAEDKNRTNWITEFSSTVDLKKAVRKQLEKESLKEELAKLMRERDVPTITIMNENNHNNRDVGHFDTNRTIGGVTLPCRYICLRFVLPTQYTTNMEITCSDNVLAGFIYNNILFDKMIPGENQPHFHIVFMDRASVFHSIPSFTIAVHFTMSNGYILCDHFRITFSRGPKVGHEITYLGKELVSKGKLYETPS